MKESSREETASVNPQAASTTSLTRPCSIQNFRPAAGLSSRIYRCASTDGLADIVVPDEAAEFLHEAERQILQKTGLVLDLRSPSERDEERALQWSSGASFRTRDSVPTEEEDDEDSNILSNDENSSDRQLVRIDVLSPTRFFSYADQNFLTPTQQALSKLYMIAQADKAHELRIEALNERGLAGLNEVVLETGGKELCLALKEITKQLERNNALDVVIHCVQGKDRTGMLVMLCQSMVGLSDDEIIADYHKSNDMKFGSAAADDIASTTKLTQPRRRGKLDRRIFSGASKQAMTDTLSMLRGKYGSIDGYLDHVGFTLPWRERFRRGLLVGQGSRSRL